MSLFPYLFIGVGGTGGKTIGMIHYNLTQALKRLGIDAFPMGWQFLHIDVPAKQDVASPKLHYNLPADTYVPLTTTQSSYVQVDYAISESLQAGVSCGTWPGRAGVRSPLRAWLSTCRSGRGSTARWAGSRLSPA